MGKRKDRNINEGGDPPVIIDLGEKLFIGRIVDKKGSNKDLKKDEKLIFNIVRDRKEVSQCKLSRISGFSKFKISRIVKDLENKGLIKREKKGLTFLVRLRK